MAPIDEALKAIGSLETPNYSKYTRLFHCDRTTLSRRHRGITNGKAVKYEEQSLLSDQQQKSLVEYINTLSARGIPPTNLIVTNFAKEICGKQPSKN
jgi:hypothetical protein